MNVRILSVLWLISVIVLFYFLKEIAFFYLIAGYIFFAIKCFRERNFDWESTLSFGIALSFAGIAALLSIGIIGFLLRLVGPLPTILVFIICSVSLIVLGMVYALTRVKLQSDIEMSHGLRIGLVLFLCALIIGIPSYVFAMNRATGHAVERDILKASVESFWAFMDIIDPHSSLYVEDLIKRQQVTYEQLRLRYERPPPSVFSRIKRILSDEVLAERFELSPFVFKTAIRGAFMGNLIRNADLSAKAWNVMSEEQRADWTASLERDINSYLQKPRGKVLPERKTEIYDAQEMLNLGYSPLTDWSFRQAFMATNVWMVVQELASSSQSWVKESRLSPAYEYELIQTYDERTHFIASLAIANSIIIQDTARACAAGFCEDALIFDRYLLQPGCFGWIRQEDRPEICKQHIDEKPWLCDIHPPDADCPRRVSHYLQT